WAASNGDRSENGDYLYGKKRLREIDRRIRFLTKRLDRAEVVDPAQQAGLEQVFFGATVSYLRRPVGAKPGKGDSEETVTIVGIDEVDPPRRRVSWISPIARALAKAREGDVVTLRTPAGVDELEVIEVRSDPVDWRALTRGDEGDGHCEGPQPAGSVANGPGERVFVDFAAIGEEPGSQHPVEQQRAGHPQARRMGVQGKC